MLTALKILVYTYHKNNFQSFIVKSKVIGRGEFTSILETMERQHPTFQYKFTNIRL
jgi:hypothetical protein